MGKYSVPEEIRKFKPKGTMVKVINGKYYVYEQTNVKIDGKWKIKMGKMIGSISIDLGFVPNNNFSNSQMITTLDFGEYFLSYHLSKNILDKLKLVFNVKEALSIYNIALIHFVNGFSYMKSIKPQYDLSYLSLKYPSISLSEHIVSKLLETLGRHTSNIEKFEDLLIENSSKKLAVDGHSIKSCGYNNSLSEDGNKKHIFKDKQINLLMAYDINNSNPVFSRMYAGATMDNISFKDLFERKNFKDILFIIDKGFYSTENINLCSSNGNKYIVPLKAHLLNYKEITKDYLCNERFVYENGKKRTVIEYKTITKDDVKIIFYRDLSLAALDSADYLSKVSLGNNTYTMEKYEEFKNTFGTIVLQTNLNKNPDEIYKLYKKRWEIETFYDYYKNKLDVNALHISDYYQTQGLSFILLITSLIHTEFIKATKQLKRNITEILLDAKFIKLHYKKNSWALENVCKSHYELFSNLNIDLNEEVKYINSLK